MINTRIITREEQDIIIHVEDDIRVMQCVLWDNELLYDKEYSELDRATEALLYGAYYDDIGYVMKGLDILKETLQNIEGLETEDFEFSNNCIIALQKVVDRHVRK